MAEEDVLYYCIPQSQCRLCQFELEEGEGVVAGVDDMRVSSEFQFFRNTTFYDDDIFGIKFHTCCRKNCGFRGRQSACFHSSCYNFRLYAVSPQLLAATTYSFRRPILEERRRRDRIIRILTERLKASWTKGLPDELCRIIAGFLVRECAVVTAQELEAQNSAANSVVDLSHDVYVRYIMIDGIQYIRTLRNSSRSTVEPGEKLLLDAQTGHGNRNVYIGEDHLGIRQVQFCSSRDTSSKGGLYERGLWWRQLSHPCGILEIRTITDGLKLRDLFDAREQSDTPRDKTYWPIPAPSAKLIALGRPEREPSGLRMSFFECNALYTTGYSVATNGVSTTTVHTHGQNKDLAFYKEVDSFFGRSMVWIYMPMDQDEYVAEICRRFGFRHVGLDSLGLMFTTNRGRTTLFGCYLQPPSNEDYRFDRVHTPPEGPSQIYFNEWDSISAGNEVKFLGFEHTEPLTPRPYPESLVPISSCPQTTYNEPWFYSFCSMEDVVEIILCVDQSAGHRPIIGMLLSYSDKHRACVGQFRLDWVLKPIAANQVGKLHIGTKRTQEGFPFVAYVDMTLPTDCSTLSWLEVSWNGTLEWSFSRRQCKLHYNSK